MSRQAWASATPAIECRSAHALELVAPRAWTEGHPPWLAKPPCLDRTPDLVVDRLASAMAEVSRDPAFISKTTGLGIVPTARGPKEFAAFIKAEVDTNTALLGDAGYQPE